MTSRSTGGFAKNDLRDIRCNLDANGLWQGAATDKLNYPPYCVAFHHAAWNLFPKHHHARLENGAIVYRLNRGGSLVVSLNQEPELTAKAQLLGNNSFVTWVSSGLLRAIFELAAGLWTSPKFLPNVGNPRTLEATKQQIGLPQGLEYVRLVTEAETESDIHDHAPEWLNTALATLDPLRQYGFERSVVEAIQFLLLHEIAHVNLGHLELKKSLNGHCEIDELGLEIIDDAYLTDEMVEIQRCMEIQADRFAITAVLRKARQQAKQNTPSSFINMQASLVGLFSVMIIFHSNGIFKQRPEKMNTHPPLWFRGSDILEIYRTLEASGRDGLIQRNTLSKLLNSIISIHPIFGEWLGPIQDSAYLGFRNHILNDAKAAMARHKPALQKYERTIKVRPESQLVLDFSLT